MYVGVLWRSIGFGVCGFGFRVLSKRGLQGFGFLGCYTGIYRVWELWFRAWSVGIGGLLPSRSGEHQLPRLFGEGKWISSCS